MTTDQELLVYVYIIFNTYILEWGFSSTEEVSDLAEVVSESGSLSNSDISSLLEKCAYEVAGLSLELLLKQVIS